MALETRHAIYAASLELLTLRKDALADLTRRGLLNEDIAAVGYRSIPLTGGALNDFLRSLVDKFGEETLRHCPGFVNEHGRTHFWAAGPSSAGQFDGYIVPYRDENNFITGIQLKVFGGRYLTARNSRISEIYHVAGNVGAGLDLYLTEGGLKAQVAFRLGGGAIIGLPGQSLAREHMAVIRRLQPGRAIEALDHENNVTTAQARERWLHALVDAGLETYRAVWEGADVGGPKGIDDLFAAGGRPRLRTVHFVPAETGHRRHVWETGAKGKVDTGLTLFEARRQTQRAIDDFVSGARRRR